MRSSFSRVATFIVVGLQVLACGPAPSPLPVTIPSPTSSSAATTPTPTPSPLTVSPTNGAIAAGYFHTCVLTSAGEVKCWGANDLGQLGNGTTTNSSVPVQVSGLSSDIRAISAGSSHNCSLTSAGGVKCWGYNMYGQLGNGTNSDSNVPVDVTGFTSGVAAITLGWGHACALTFGGGVKCWGNNPFGGLGNGTNLDSSVPVEVSGLGSGVIAIAAGGRHTCALTRAGRVSCWGDGQAADTSVFHSSVPVDVLGLAAGVRAIAAGNDLTCALTNSGGVTCWGPNYAPPADGSLPDRFVTVAVSGLTGALTAIVVGDTHRCVLTSDGEVACWGGNSYGQLGNFTTTSSGVPVEIADLGAGVTAIAAGGMHNCALTTGGRVACWGSNYVFGSNYVGVLGDGTQCHSSSVPVYLPLDADAATPKPSIEPTRTPTGRIDHATSSRDVVFRFDRGPDVGVGELEGELFQPGPEFTLFGDGTVIFRNQLSQLPSAEGPIVRARPFMIAQLDEDQVQSLLQFAIGEGGLADACEVYVSGDVDGVGSDVFTLRAGGVDKRVVNGGPAPFQRLYDYLDAFGGGNDLSTQVWEPARYRGSLLEAANAIEVGVLPAPREVGIFPWPWPDIAPEDFVRPADPGWESPRRVMSADEAAVLGLSDHGGVVQRAYLLGPDGETIYYFSLWPMLPDETN